MNRREKRIRRGRPASGGARELFTQSSFINSDGFTLIELLVVISILVMLMAVLLPTLQRVRKQAKAVACQAKLRQWGLVFKMYTDANGGRWFTEDWEDGRKRGPGNWLGLTSPFWFNTPGFAACPMATKRPEDRYYDAFAAWWAREWYLTSSPSGAAIFGPVSYSFNDCVSGPPPGHPNSPLPTKEVYWRVCDVRGAGVIPVFFDSAMGLALADHHIGPPLFDAGPRVDQIYVWPMCINRHDGGINMLFMDWSVRKVGLKELWTFKWNKIFDIGGPWTKQGGVEPADWPQWMRGFKDY